METELRRWLHDAGKLGCRFRNTWFACSLDQSRLALDRWSSAYACERALYPHRHYANEPQTKSNPDVGCRPKVARVAYVVGEAACHPNFTRSFCSFGISVGPPIRADRQICWLEAHFGSFDISRQTSRADIRCHRAWDADQPRHL